MKRSVNGMGFGLKAFAAAFCVLCLSLPAWAGKPGAGPGNGPGELRLPAGAGIVTNAAPPAHKPPVQKKDLSAGEQKLTTDLLGLVRPVFRLMATGD